VEQDQRPSKEKKKLDLKYFREKDKKYLNKKLQRKLKNQKEESERELRLEKIKSGRPIMVVSDPNRIFKPTQNFKNYVNALHTDKPNGPFASMEHANAFFHPGNEFQHRYRINKKIYIIHLYYITLYYIILYIIQNCIKFYIYILFL